MMNVPNHKDDIPLQHYSTLLAEQDPETVSARTGIPFREGAFLLKMLNREIRITHPEVSFTFADTGAELKANAKILLARLLTGGALAEYSGPMLSYAEMPWGETYLQQFRGRCINRLAFGFANDPESFAKACLKNGGRKVEGTENCYDLPFLPTLTMRLTVWPAEEDFPPSAQILFSGNFPIAFSAEDMAVCGDILLDALKGRF